MDSKTEQRRLAMPTVELRGNADLRKALRRFAPDLEKTLRKELGRALRPVVRQAKGYVPSDSPMSGWAPRSFSEARFPFYSATEIKKGIGYTTSVGKVNRNGFSSMAAIQNKSPVGAIYEGAGRLGPQKWVGPKAGGKSKGVSRSTNPGAGKQFLANLAPLSSSLKGTGRLIYRAWGSNRGLAEGASMRAIDKALTQFRARAKQNPLSRAA
jgi:hypothetical protein